ncbi:MAG TPA: ABC transporter ATP-binding protein [Candidatus Eremiobacteraceae bacterium]|nr:ABC transporter ATP-binding protein [Candidatus Eremiobacteraceae bacterium]
MTIELEAPAIDIRSLTKSYGTTAAVNNLSVAIPKGSIFGLLGTNGAGKTTTFKCILGLARPTSGQAMFGGYPLRPELFESISYMPEQPALYTCFTGQQHIDIARHSFAKFDKARAQHLVELFGLDLRKKVQTLSKGQQSALALTLAFATRPEMLVLDEPSSGLDPVHQRNVLDLMIDAAAGGATVVFSSHQIGQVERAADHVAILHRGNLVLQGSVEDLKAEEKIIEATFDSDAPRFAELDANPNVRRVMRQGRLIRAYVTGTGDGAVAAITAAAPTSMRVLNQNLEDIFLAAVGGN